MTEEPNFLVALTEHFVKKMHENDNQIMDECYKELKVLKSILAELKKLNRKIDKLGNSKC